jgi:hypothetical protein
VARDERTLPGPSPEPDAQARSTARPTLARPEQRRSISGAYSVAEAQATTAPPSQGERVSWTEPISVRSSKGLSELRRMPLAAMTVTADRRLISANPSARRLLDLHLGFELDDQHLRCTEPDFAPRFAKLVGDATAASQRRREFHGVFELRRPGADGWLDVVVAAHPEQGSPYALVVARSRR